jgi:hypothetical protein
MHINDINPDALKQTVDHLGDAFVTRDVSENAELRAAHTAWVNDPQWHRSIGRALSHLRVELGIESAGKSPRGDRWSKLDVTHTSEHASTSRAPSAPSALSSKGARSKPSEPATGLGPQFKGDAPFTALMRKHQSWWRAHVLQVPCGTGPNRSSTKHYGNMLEASAATAGKNFLTSQIHEVALQRLAEGRGTIEPYRLLHNLLSSQPMCCNLFGPLVDNPERATRMVRALLGDEVRSVVRVAIEWSPTPAAEYLGDLTAFDAFMDYERADGTRAALGIETKLTDTFSQKPYDGQKYRRWMRGPSSPFLDDKHVELQSPRHNQLWRNQLLATALSDHASSPYALVRSAVVHHPLDEDGKHVIASYQTLLRPNHDSFRAWTLDDVISAFERVALPDERAWLAAFRTRYLEVERSGGVHAVSVNVVVG